MEQMRVTLKDLRVRLAWAQGELNYQRQLVKYYEEMLEEAEREEARLRQERPQ